MSQLMIRISETSDETRPFMEVIRDLDADAILMDDDPRLPELEAIRETALNNDCALAELIKLKPEKEASYRKGWEEAEADLEKRARKLKIKSL